MHVECVESSRNPDPGGGLGIFAPPLTLPPMNSAGLQVLIVPSPEAAMERAREELRVALHERPDALVSFDAGVTFEPFLQGLASDVISGRALAAWLVQNLTGAPFRLTWTLSSLLFFIVPGWVVLRRERQVEGVREGAAGTAGSSRTEDIAEERDDGGR